MDHDPPGCSMPNCPKAATLRVAAPWTDGVAADLRVYGYSCVEHSGAVVAWAELRLLRSSLLPGESIGEVGVYRREESPVVTLRPR